MTSEPPLPSPYDWHNQPGDQPATAPLAPQGSTAPMRPAWYQGAGDAQAGVTVNIHQSSGPPLRPFVFDGGAATYLGSGIAAFLVTVLSLGILTPWALVIRYRWRSKHTIINGYRVRFTGSAIGLFGNWIKWWFLIVITLGIYLFWVVPRLTKWIVESQEFVGVARL